MPVLEGWASLNNMRTKGKIAVWDDKRGFGFIEPSGGGQRVFLHITAFRNRARHPAVGRSINYTLSPDERGRPRALHASIAGIPDPWRIARWLSICLAMAFFAFVGLSVLADLMPPICFPFVVVLSVLTFIAYALDKSAARKNAWRVREKSLHILSFLGGWPGALVAQRFFHHKTGKLSFQIVFWATVLMNCAAFAWATTPHGSATLHSLISRLS